MSVLLSIDLISVLEHQDRKRKRIISIRSNFDTTRAPLCSVTVTVTVTVTVLDACAC